MKNIKYNTVGTVPKTSTQIVHGGKRDIHSTQMHGHSLSWIDTSTSLKGGGAMVVLWVQTKIDKSTF